MNVVCAMVQGKSARLLFFLLMALGPILLGGCTTEVPNLVGLHRNTAEALILVEDYSIGTVSEAFDGTAGEQEVLAQSPLAGTQAEAGTAIDFTVNRGFHLRNYTGMSRELAEVFLGLDSVLLGTITQVYSIHEPIDRVLDQFPDPMIIVDVNTEVDLTVSMGTVVPDLSGKTLQEATVLLLAAGLVLGTIEEGYDVDAVPGVVLEQSIAANTAVDPGSAVDVTYNRGVVLEDYVGLQQGVAENMLALAGLNLGAIVRSYSIYEPVGQIVAQTPLPGTIVDLESPVGFTVSVGQRLLVNHANVLLKAAQDGYTWETAFSEIQDAIDAAPAWPGYEIWVAQGTYDEDRSADNVSGAIFMKPFVGIYGGFTGLETFKEQRDWERNPTILSGANGRGPGEPAHHVVFGVDDSVLDGFTITGGHAVGSGASGAGMFNYDASPLVANCLFVANSAFRGGGVYNAYGASPIVFNCTFLENTASIGAGMHNHGGLQPEVWSCVFTRNHASSGGGAITCYEWGEIKVFGSSFVGNSTSRYGGALSFYSAGNATAVANSEFIGNTAELDGGAISASNNFGHVRTLNFTNNTFVENTSQLGNALDNSKYAVDIINNIVWGNVTRGGGVYSTGVEINTEGPNPLMLAYSIVEGGYDDGVNGATMVDGPPQFVGSVASGLGDVVIYDASTYQSSLIHAGQFVADTLAGLTLWLDLDNNGIPESAFYIVSNDVNSIMVWGDATGTTTYAYDVWDFSLQSTSPAIDTGMDTSHADYGSVVDDILGVTRPQDGDGLGAGSMGDGSDYDIGAYEYVLVP